MTQNPDSECSNALPEQDVILLPTPETEQLEGQILHATRSIDGVWRGPHVGIELDLTHHFASVYIRLSSLASNRSQVVEVRRSTSSGVECNLGYAKRYTYPYLAGRVYWFLPRPDTTGGRCGAYTSVYEEPVRNPPDIDEGKGVRFQRWLFGDVGGDHIRITIVMQDEPDLIQGLV